MPGGLFGRQMPNGRIQAAQGFVAYIKQSLASRHLKHDAPIFVICENGRHAAFAAELLAHAGVPNVFVVRGGISGEETEGGKSTGWMAARLPMRPASRLPA